MKKIGNHKMNPEEKPTASSMSQSIEDIGTLNNESDEKQIVTDSSHQNNPSSTKRGLSETSQYHNQGMVPSSNLVPDMSQLNRSQNFMVDPSFVYEADQQSLIYGPNSKSPRAEVHMGGSSHYPPSHRFAFAPSYKVDNSVGENQLSRQLWISRNISLEWPQMISPGVQSDWPVNNHSRTLPPTYFQNVNSIGTISRFNINASGPKYPENLVGRLMHLGDGMHRGNLSNANNYGTNTSNNFESGFLSHQNIKGKGVLNTAIGMAAPSAYPQINSMQNMASGIYGDYDVGMMSGSNHEFILGPPYVLERPPGNDEHHNFELNSENLDNVSTDKLGTGGSQAELDLELNLSNGGSQAELDLELNLSNGGSLPSSSAKETADRSLPQQLEQLNMNYIRNMPPHPSMDSGAYQNTRQKITMRNLPGQAPAISHENNPTLEIWRKRNLAQLPIPNPPPQRQKRQGNPPFFPQAVNLDQTPLPYMNQIVHPSPMSPFPHYQASPAFSLPRRNTTPPFAPPSHTSSSQPQSAAQFPSQFSQSPSTIPSVSQASTGLCLSPLSKGKGKSPVLQSQRTVSSVSHPSLNIQCLPRGPAVSLRPRANAGTSQPPTMRGTPLRPAASPVETLHRPSKKTPSPLSPSHNLPVFHIKSEVPEKSRGPLGHKCFLCKRDLAYNEEGPISLPASFPGVAILPCGHVFHDECLKKITPDNDTANPPCIPCAVGE